MSYETVEQTVETVETETTGTKNPERFKEIIRHLYSIKDADDKPIIKFKPDVTQIAGSRTRVFTGQELIFVPKMGVYHEQVEMNALFLEAGECVGLRTITKDEDTNTLRADNLDCTEINGHFYWVEFRAESGNIVIKRKKADAQAGSTKFAEIAAKAALLQAEHDQTRIERSKQRAQNRNNYRSLENTPANPPKDVF